MVRKQHITSKNRPVTQRSRHDAQPTSTANDLETISQVPATNPDLQALRPQDVLNLQRTVGNRATIGLLSKGRAALQRAFQPATVNTKSHLRAINAGNVVPGQKTGAAIPNNAEVVIDTAQQQVQVRKVFSDVTWTRAVNVTGAAWDPAAHPNAGGFIRSTSVTPKVYPQNVTLDIASRGTFNLQKLWHEQVGEYIPFENSLETPADRIVKVGAAFKRLDAGNQLHDLTPLEATQVNDVSREDAAEKRLHDILTKAAIAGGINPALLATNENIGIGAPIDEGLKHPLRLTQGTHTQQDKVRWNQWASAVYAKIASGAADLVASINHWKSQLSPLNPALCNVTRIKMDGSDLHDKGLGAVFVTFTKPVGGLAAFAADTNFTVVLKPEDRNIEKSLFGTQGTSLASQVNNLAGLGVADEITKIKMETHAQHGSIIEFVQGQQARAINGGGADTQAMSEGIAFAFLAGMSDVHQDNVIWQNGKPYFIDADNSLNASKLQTPQRQTGFTMNNDARTNTDIDDLDNTPQNSRSQIVQQLLLDSTPLLAAVQAAFTGKTGRVVPLFTNYWAKMFTQAGYITANDGNPGDGAGVNSRWRKASLAATKIPNPPVAEDGTGLEGESGIASAGRHFDLATETAQIKVDLDQGKIPFYHYNYTTGHVLHNGQTIWHGQSLADAMTVLLAKFPAPPPIAPIVDDGGG